MKKTRRAGAVEMPYAINGKTHMVTVDPPKPPLDLDRIVLGAVTALVAAMLLVAVVWSTVKIGGLLELRAPAWAAYTAAVTFDAAWIICMALEWHARHEPRRARTPRIAGWLFLAAAMAAIIADGHLAGEVEVGIISAAVSAIVKAVWTLVLNHYATPLDALTQQWYERERAEIHAQRGLADAEKGLLRTQHQIAETRAAYGLPPAGQQRPVPQLEAAPATHEPPHDAAGDAAPVHAGHTTPAAPIPVPAAAAAAPVDDPVQIARIIDAALADAGSKAEMVRRVRGVAPAWTSQQIAAELTRRGVKISDNYVRTIDGRPKPKRVERPELLAEQPPLDDADRGPYL